MCGICGIISSRKVMSMELERMADAISHRGPDDDGYYLRNGTGMGHRRLSIIDLDSGHQPISNEDGTLWIVFNGEIYNFKSLRDELLLNGHIFKTRTDTEVILHLYEDEAEGCLERLNGMFAFALWDEKQNKLFIARDRIGQKPLFYMQNKHDFLFASEVKSIIAHSEVERSVDLEAVHHYLSLRFIPPPLTMFKNVQKLPAGHYLVYKDYKLQITRYWDLDFNSKVHLTEEDYLEQLRAQLLKTVESHLVSDVPVGAFLSGGMDTSMVVAIMGHTSKTRFKTFSIGVKEQDFNELPFAKIVSRRYQTEHIERVVSANLVKLIPTMIWFLDEPSDPIAACMFQAAKLASEHVKVVLGGDGGDELFAGFDRYVGMRLVDYYKMIPPLFRKRLLKPLIRRLPDSYTYKSVPQKLRWLHQLSEFDAGDRYAEATSFFRFTHHEKSSLFQPGVWQNLKDIHSNQVIVNQFDKDNASDPIDKMLYADFMTRLAEHTLMLTDRMNMAHGLEARSPFLDHELVELLATFPSSIKIHGRELKYILRRLGRNYLPEEITKREKQGFMFPVAYWFRNELYPYLNKVFKHSKLHEAGIINFKKVMNLIDQHRHNKIDNHVRLWMLLNLEFWFRMYIEGKDCSFLSKEISNDLPPNI